MMAIAIIFGAALVGWRIDHAAKSICDCLRERRVIVTQVQRPADFSAALRASIGRKAGEPRWETEMDSKPRDGHCGCPVCKPK